MELGGLTATGIGVTFRRRQYKAEFIESNTDLAWFSQERGETHTHAMTSRDLPVFVPTTLRLGL